jgi:alcohol dehydrogenase YqhD (iron-dependent ADH family)
MDPMAVITNAELNLKYGVGSNLFIPKFSILNPTYTYSVPASQTAAGTADIMSHVFESYFTLGDGAYLINRLAEGILQTCIHYAPIAIKEPENYEARANLMWASSQAINGLLKNGKATPWSVHAMEHALSAYFDVTHGVGLAILTPVWMEYILNDDTVQMFAEYGWNVWHLDRSADKWATAREAIAKTSEFFASLNIPMTLHELNIPEDMLETMAKNAPKGGDTIRGVVPLHWTDVLEIYKRAY